MGVGDGGVITPEVLRLPNVDIRRILFLIFAYDDLSDEIELSDGAADVIEVVVRDGVFVYCWPSLELQDIGCVDSEARDGVSRGSGGVDARASADTLLVTTCNVVCAS